MVHAYMQANDATLKKTDSTSRIENVNKWGKDNGVALNLLTAQFLII